MVRRAVFGLAGLIGLVGVVIARQGSTTPEVRTVSVPPNTGGLAVDGQLQRAFVSGPNGRVQILDTAAGVLLRTVNLAPVPDSVFVTGVIVSARSRHIFVVTRHFSSTTGTHDVIVMLDTRHGQVLRAIPLKTGHGSTPLIADARTNRVFVIDPPPWPGREGQVIVLDATSGQVVRRVALAGMPSNVYSLVLDPGTGNVFLADTDTGVVSALDGITGRRLWQRSPSKSAVPGHLVMTGMPAVDGRHHRVFIANFVTGMVEAYDMRDGRSVGVARLSHPGATTMIVNTRADRVFAIQAGWIHMLDAASGRLLRAISVGQRFGFVHGIQLTVDGVSDHMLLVDSRGNAVSLLDGTSGQLLHTSSLPPITLATSPAIDTRRGSIVVANAGLPDRWGNLDNPASISVIDDATGIVRRIIPVGRGPGEVAMDEQAGRVVVLNPACPASLVTSTDPWRWIPGTIRHLFPFPSLPKPSVTTGCVSIVDIAH